MYSTIKLNIVMPSSTLQTTQVEHLQLL